MPGFDIFLILFIASFALYGFFRGLIKTVGAIVALVAGVWLAGLFYLPVFALAEKLFFGFEKVGHSVIFLILFIVANRLVNFLFVLVEASYNSLFFIPFLKTLNRIFGAIFGLALGALMAALALYGLYLLPFAAPLIKRLSVDSEIAVSLLNYAAFIVPFIPNLWEKIRGYNPNAIADIDLNAKVENLDINSAKNLFLEWKDKVWNTSK